MTKLNEIKNIQNNSIFIDTKEYLEKEINHYENLILKFREEKRVLMKTKERDIVKQYDKSKYGAISDLSHIIKMCLNSKRKYLIRYKAI